MCELEFSQQVAKLIRKEGYLAKTEINSGYGIADVVAIRTNQRNTKLRLEHKQTRSIQNEHYFKLLELLNEDQQAPTDIRYLSRNLTICQPYIRTILKNLCNYGFAKKVDNGFYIKINGWAPLSNNIIAIESKLKNWQRGLLQAWRYKKFADKSYLAMPEDRVHLVSRQDLKTLNIGLLTLSDDKLKYLFKPVSQNRQIVPSKRNYVCEFFWDEMQKVY